MRLSTRCPGIALEFNREQPPLTGTLFVTEEAIFPSQTRKSPTTGANRHQPQTAKIREEVAGLNPVTPTILDTILPSQSEFPRFGKLAENGQVIF